MQTKLRLEKILIQQAKNDEKVSDYCQLLKNGTKNTALPPITRSLVGVVESKNVDIDGYKKYLEDKYL